MHAACLAASGWAPPRWCARVRAPRTLCTRPAHAMWWHRRARMPRAQMHACAPRVIIAVEVRAVRGATSRRRPRSGAADARRLMQAVSRLRTALQSIPTEARADAAMNGRVLWRRTLGPQRRQSEL